jgi:hypothetical protein
LTLQAAILSPTALTLDFCFRFIYSAETNLIPGLPFICLTILLHRGRMHCLRVRV